jgi:predicted SprT family Zn-dependent metalloprotease
MRNMQESRFHQTCNDCNKQMLFVGDDTTDFEGWEFWCETCKDTRNADGGPE